MTDYGSWIVIESKSQAFETKSSNEMPRLWTLEQSSSEQDFHRKE
jgi:hypothetical protein